MLLDTGPSSVGNLAKVIGLPRPTLYGYLDKLVKGGLVTQSIRQNVKTFVPESGGRIRTLYRRKIDELKTQEKELDNIIPNLEKRAGLKFMRPRIKHFEGRDGIETALQDHLSYQDTEMLAFWSIRSAIEATSEDFFWYINKERIRRNMYLKGIWPPNQVVEIKRYPFMGVGDDFKREIRIAPEGTGSSMGYWVYANKVLFASSNVESFSYIIESSELVEMMSNQHKLLWNLSAPITPKPEDMKPFLDDLYNH